MKLTQVDLLRLDPAARTRLFDEMQVVATQRMPSSPRDYFDRGFASSDLRFSRAGLLRDASGQLVGMQLISARDLQLEGQRLTVVRSGAAKALHLEGTPKVFDAFAVRELVGIAVRSWARRRSPWLVATSNNPVTYLRMARYFSRMVPPPAPGRPPDPTDDRVYRALAAEIGITLDHDFPFACSSQPPIPLTEEERASWAARPEPAIARLVAECPRFGIDQVLVFGVPLSPRAVAGMVAGVLGR